MKKTTLRIISIIASTVITTSLFTGCAAKKVDKAPEKSEGPVEIRIMARVNPEVKFENNNVMKEIEKLANVKLEIDAPPINNYVDRLQITMASGDLPDLIYNWGGADANYEKWASDGLLAELDDKITKYPNLMKNITKEMWEGARSVETGKIQQIPKPNVKNYWGYIINQKWLDKLGLKAPTTLDEFTQVCKAFTTQDPDGNGKADTYGVSSVGTFGMQFLMSAFNLTNSLGAKDVDGNYKIKEKFEGYIPYLTYLKKLYAEKILDPEFFTNKMYADNDKQNSNRVGITYGHQVGVLGALVKTPDAVEKLTYNAPIKNEKGESIAYMGAPTWGAYIIPKDTKNIDGVLKFLDWSNSQEGFILTNLGVKGTHYNDYDFETKTVTRTVEQSKLLSTVASSYTTYAYAYNGNSAMIENGDTTERVKKYNDDLNAAKKIIKEVTLPSVKSPKLVNLNSTNPDDVKKLAEMEIKYIVGEITIEQLKDYLTKEYYPKVDEAEKEYLDVMKKIDEKK